MNAVFFRQGGIFRQSRIAKGLSQQKVATMLGVHVRQYQRLEYGERSIGKVNMELGLSLCRVLEIDPFLLVFSGRMETLCQHVFVRRKVT